MIAVIPWIKGNKFDGTEWTYDLSRVMVCVNSLAKAAPGLPIYVATPHADDDLGVAKPINCARFLQRTRLFKCGVMAAAFHPDLDHHDVLLVTADTIVLQDPRVLFSQGGYQVPRQHIERCGDWFVHIPASHPNRRKVYDAAIASPHQANKFDKMHWSAVRSSRLKWIEPPAIINGEWIARGWDGWSQPVTDGTYAVHPDGGVKFPEFADSHPWFQPVKDHLAKPVPSVPPDPHAPVPKELS